MRSLFVVRHAKSSWDDPGLSDFERPLNKRGRKAAPFMGEYMRSEGLVPELIVSSPATRAKMTAQLISEAGDFDAPIVFDERIYGAGAYALSLLVAEQKVAGTLMIVGHNPGFEHLVGLLSGEHRRMPTAALAVIDLDIESWELLSGAEGKLRRIHYPKDLMKK